MATVTPNFNWPVPTSTDLVKDGATAIEALGDSIDASMVDLKGGTSGQILAKNSNTDMDFVWITNDQGDITGVTATSPLTGGGTSGAITVGILSATTSNLGAVQLSTSTSSTSTSLAATASAVKEAYDPAFTNNFYAGKNKCLNGAMQIAQRGTSITLAAGGYTLDRYYYEVGTAIPTGTITQQTFTPGTAPVAGYEGSNFARVTITANNGCTVMDFSNMIEDVRTFAGQTVTFSFWAKADGASNLGSTNIAQNFGAGGSGLVNTAITMSSTALTTGWTRYTGTVTIPSVSGKTIGAGSFLRIFTRIPTSAGVLRNGTYDFWGFQLEAGSVATPFQTATGNQALELAACQRYYYRSTGGALYSSYGSGYATLTTEAVYVVKLPVTMRTRPTGIEYGNLGVGLYNVSTIAITNLVFNTQGVGVDFANVVATVASGLTQYRGYDLTNNNNTAGFIGFSAEF